MPTRPRVWITGFGAVSGASPSRDGNTTMLRYLERRPINELPFESGISCPTFQVTAELGAYFGDGDKHSRTLRLANNAVREAIGSRGGFRLPDQVGICLGTTVASQLNNIPFYDAYRRGANPPLDAVHDYLNANLADAVGRLWEKTGPRMTIVNACSSGTDAIGVAAAWIRAGLCDVAIAGGADELNRVALAGFWSLGVMSTQPCMPFDRDRSGLNLGEGAGILILESDDHCKRRGHSPRIEVAGFGAACDAHHLTAPHPEGRGLEAAIRTALGQADIAPEKVAFVNAHGTATPENDRAEAKVLARIFGPNVKFLSTKGYTGHTLGAAGGLEAVFTVLGLYEQWLPPSVGFQNQADDIPVAPISEPMEISGEYGLSTSLAFGGNNSAVLIRRTA